MTAQKKSSQRAQQRRCSGMPVLVSSWLKDTCPAEAMEILSERVQIARCQARVVFASRLRACRAPPFRFLVSYMPLALQNAPRFAARDYDAAGIEPTLCGIREVIPQSTASSG